MFGRVQCACTTGNSIGDYDFNTVKWYWQLLRLALDALINFFLLFVSINKNMPYQSLFIGMSSKYFLFVEFSLVYYHSTIHKYYHIYYSYYHMKTYFAFISVDAGIQL